MMRLTTEIWVAEEQVDAARQVMLAAEIDALELEIDGA